MVGTVAEGALRTEDIHLVDEAPNPVSGWHERERGGGTALAAIRSFRATWPGESGQVRMRTPELPKQRPVLKQKQLG